MNPSHYWMVFPVMAEYAELLQEEKLQKEL